MPISVEDVEVAVKEMLKKGLLINPEKICLYMNIDPIVVLPRSSTGEWRGCIDNKIVVYNHLHTLREKRDNWRKRHKDARASYREGYTHASFYDSKTGRLVNYKDVMSYEEFIDIREPKEGIFLIPKSDAFGIYIIPTHEEEKDWRKKHILGGTKTFKTRIEKAMNAGYLEDTRKTRKFIEGFDPDKYLTYKEVEEEGQDEI